mgnify:CR=1 FL=1
MNTKEHLEYVVKEIHTVIVATVDDDGLPVTSAIDMMDADEGGLYFLTAKGKGFYDRLKKREFPALTATKGDDTMNSVAISIRGKVRDLGFEKIPELFEKNQYMYQIYEGNGEWFDLSKRPIERDSFPFGAAEKKEEGYFITEDCIGCGSNQEEI